MANNHKKKFELVKSAPRFLKDDKLGPIKEICEADLFVLSMLSYMCIEYIVENSELPISIGVFTKRYNNSLIAKKVDRELYHRFMEALENNKRYRDILIVDYSVNFNSAKNVQFGAILGKLTNDEMFVSFRGTDQTILGWKEDAYMAISKNIASSELGIAFLNNSMNSFPNSKFYVLGHSKGAHLAVYCSSFLDFEKQERIKYIMDLDGPGFKKDFLDFIGYIQILPKIHTFIPKFAIIGLLFSKKSSATVISSNSKINALQHDGFTWNIRGRKLDKIGEFNADELDSGGINKIMNSMTEEEIKMYINVTYNLLADSEIVLNLRDVLLLKRIHTSLEKYKNLTKDEQKLFLDTTLKLIKSISTPPKNKKHENK